MHTLFYVLAVALLFLPACWEVFREAQHKAERRGYENGYEYGYQCGWVQREDAAHDDYCRRDAAISGACERAENLANAGKFLAADISHD